MQSTGQGYPLPENIVMVLRTEEIREDGKHDPSITIATVANLMQQNIFLDGDYYRPVPKDVYINELLATFGN